MHWACAEPVRAAAYQLIVDIAHTLAERALTNNNIRLARWAASQGLLADPHSEVLLADRLRTEYAAGDRIEAGRIAGQITAQARELGMDLGPDTIDTLQQVVAAGTR